VVGYMPGDNAILLTSDLNGGLNRLYLKDLKSGKVTEPLPALSKYELDGAGLNDRRDMVGGVSNEDGYGVPHLYTVAGLKSIQGPSMDKGIVGGSEFRGSTLVWSLQNARNAGEAYASTLSPNGAPVTKQVTWTENAGVDLSHFTLPELVHYPAFDGKSIPA